MVGQVKGPDSQIMSRDDGPNGWASVVQLVQLLCMSPDGTAPKWDALLWSPRDMT